MSSVIQVDDFEPTRREEGKSEGAESGEGLFQGQVNPTGPSEVLGSRRPLCMATQGVSHFGLHSSAQKLVETALPQSVQATVRKRHRLAGLKTTETYFSRFWRLEVQDQGVGRFGIC